MENIIKQSLGYIEHHIGLIFILIAWGSLLISKLRGFRVKLPGHFFMLYGIGCLLIGWGMYYKSDNIGQGPMILEIAIGILSIFFYLFSK